MIPCSRFAHVALLAVAASTTLHTKLVAQNAPQVVESRTPLWTSSTALVIDPKPSLTLGAGEPLFSSVSSAHRYINGRIVVADATAREFLLFDASGKFIRKIARAGNGPAEFQAMDRILPANGDTIALWDWRARRLSTFR
jgi:hypothetical protein